MQDNITFEKGLFPQLDQTIKIPGTYLDALNIIRDEAGNVYNELGTSLVQLLESGYVIIGHYILGDDIIIIATDNNTTKIFVLDVEDNFINFLNTTVFEYTTSTRLSVEGRVNYKGERLIYIGGEGVTLRTINLDTISDYLNLDTETSLFLEYTLPRTDVTDVSVGGNVKSGIYQFATRLVNESNNTSAFGSVTSPVPVGTGSVSGNRKDYDGGDPQEATPNAVSITITDVDTTFEYIEPCVITYIGEGNIVRVRTLGKIPTLGRDTITFRYTGEQNEQGDLLESELSTDAVSYSSGKFLTQKDNTLLISGVTEEMDITEWQEIANQIKVSYVEHKLTYDEVIDVRGPEGRKLSDSLKRAGQGPWVDEGEGGTFRDYKDPINCAKFRGYKRGEVYSFTFTPVFDNGRRGYAYHIPALTPTGNMLEIAEVEDVFYPEGFGTLTGQKVRYHKMPDNTVSPFFIKESGVSKLIALGVEFELPEGDWTDKLSGYIIGRENRSGKETILSQGFLKGIYETKNDQFAPIPSFGRMYIQDTDGANRAENTNIHDNIFTFHAPDLVVENREFTPKLLRRVNRMKCKMDFANTDEDDYQNCSNLVLAEPDPTAYYSDENEITGKSTLVSESKREDDLAHLGGVNFIRSVISGKINLAYRRILSCLALETKDPYIKPQYDGIDYWQDSEKGRSSYYEITDKTPNHLRYNDFDMDLYEIEIANSSLYGNIYNKRALPIKTVLFGKQNINPITSLPHDDLHPVVFGGDTFISRFAHTLKTTVPFYGTIGTEQDVPKTSSVVYFFLESVNNYNYRHYRDTETGITMPYFPRYRTLYNESNGICDLPVANGHAELYNKQYSMSNNFQANYSKSVDEENITKFDNRTIYSATSIEGERFDAYRLFLPGNYHDIPKQYGKITGSFVHRNELYFHTERSLWRSFYNTLATQATSEGDIVLGNGGAFPRPSMPIVTIEGGYAGCVNFEASIGTPMGRFFYDANNAKVYLLSEGLAELSNPGIFNLLRTEAYKENAVLGYDAGRKRVIMSTKNLTISYKPELNSFESRHDYTFDRFCSRNMGDYLIKDNGVYKFDESKVADYYGNKYNSLLKFNSAVNNNASKLFTNAEVVTYSKSPEGLSLPFEFFDTLKMYSLERNIGYNTLRVIQDYTEDFETLGNIFVYKVNNKFRFSFPPDLVYDINKDIHDVTNLVNHSSYLDEDRILLPNMTDNHMVFEFGIDNISKSKLMKISSIIINFEQNIT